MEKVWIYLSDKELKGNLYQDIIRTGESFVQNWKAHDIPLSASFEIILGYFIVVKVDETQYNASGCSIDKLLRLIKQLETDHQLQLLNRLLVAYKTDSGIEVIHSSKIKDLLSSRVLNENSLIYNVAASNSEEYKNWQQPLKVTWLKKYL